MSLIKNWKILTGVALAILLIYLGASLYTMFMRPAAPGGNHNMGLLLAGLILGAVMVFLLYRGSRLASANVAVTANSHTVIESMKKVFKVVCAEGVFSEIYDYKETKKLLAFIPAQKSALVIVKAKVLIGYDFEKLVWEIDEENKKIRLSAVPEPEILSVEPDYRYYSIEDELFYKLGSEDFTRINARAKEVVINAAMQSDLKRIALEQMQTILPQIIRGNNWTLEDTTEKLITS